MEFDKSKVYTALNADELKVGSRGYFADNLADLTRCVAEEDKDCFYTLKEVQRPSENYRFLVGSKGIAAVYWNLFYLVEEPQEKKFRPYATEEEIMEAINLKGGAVWVKSKYSGVKHLITGICAGVIINNERINTTELLDSYTYIDNSPCGVEE